MADARDSKSREGNFMWVRPPPPAPKRRKFPFQLSFFYLNLKGVERAPKTTVFAFARPGVIAEQPSKPY